MSFAYTSILFAITFLAILSLLHFLKPELQPHWRMISEYELGRFGWLMQAAFFCWSLSVFTLLIMIWPSLTSVSGVIGRWWFVLLVLALIGAGIFKTNAITDDSTNLPNTLHALCGAIVILTFPIAATLVEQSLLQNATWSTVHTPLIVGTSLIWIGMISFFASIIISRRIDPSAGRVGPTIYLGWPNRFMVFAYVLWLLIVASNAL